MGILKSIGKFALGGTAGAATGAAAALLFAPDSGPELQRKLRERFRAAKIAGAEAKAEKETELIRKYRLTIDDRDALKDSEAQAQAARAESIAAITLNGR